jgi:hypothetical protein
MDDAEERRKRQEATTTGALRRAADVLDETKARLRETSAELRERERELDRTGDLVRDVARTTRALRTTKLRAGRTTPPPESGETPESGPPPDSSAK